MTAGWPGPEAILEVAEPRAGLEAFIVIDSTRLGPACGGIRVLAYPNERDALLDALDLAAAMTLKAALAGLPCGGAKAVVIDGPRLDRGRAFTLLGRAIEDLGGAFLAGRDVGMRRGELVRLRTATRYAADESHPVVGDLGEATARGVLAACRAALAFSDRLDRRNAPGRLDLEGTTAAVQGLGSVGLPIVRRLVEAGADVVAFDPDRGAARRGAALGARIVPSGRLASARVDLFIPASVGGRIDEAFASRSRARIVCGPANNALASHGAEEILRRRGILFVPDVIAGAGALIAGALHHVARSRDPGPAIDAIGPRTHMVLREARRTGRLATEVARRMALRRLERGR